MGQITVFTKDNCPHCVNAKSILRDADLPFEEINVSEDIPNRMLMSYLSQRYTVPQIFFNDTHIGGASDLEALGEAEILSQGAAALDADKLPDFLLSPPSDDEIATGVLPLSAALEPHLPKDWMDQKEHKVVELWYTEIFGFLADGYKYLLAKPELASTWMNTFSAIMAVVTEKLNDQWGLACFSTAYTSGCSYCSAHGAGFAMIYGQQHPENLADVIRHLNGETDLDSLPISDLQKSFVNLAGKTTNNLVTVDDIHRLRKIVGIKELGEYVRSVASMGGMMGMLTRQVDMLGLEIEAEFKKVIDNSALNDVWDWGAHDTQESDNLHNRKEIDIETMDLPTKLAELRNIIWDMNTEKRNEYDAYPDDLLPGWIGSLPDSYMRKGASQLYHCAHRHGAFPQEIKHLVAYLVTSASGYPYLAADEKRFALKISKDVEATERRLAQIDSYAKSREVSDLKDFDVKDALAIRFAECCIEYPNVAPGRLVYEMSQNLEVHNIAELLSTVAVVGLSQRYTGILRPYNEYMLSQV